MLKKLFFVALALPVFAFCSSSKENRLLYRLWNDFKTANLYDLNNFASRSLQSVHSDGARNKTQELQLIAGLHMTGYTLTEIKRTKTHRVLIFTYIATTTETINDATITSTSERMSVFQRIGKRWFWIAHASLAPVVS
jgi:hypothetical protein